MKEVFTSQQIFNRTMKDTLEASTKAQEKQTEALEKLNISTNKEIMIICCSHSTL